MVPLKILIVEDCPVIRTIVRKTLLMSPVEVDTVVEVGNGEEGLKQVRERTFDLVIVDLNMPVMSGSEMIAQMRVDPAFDNVPILTVSAESNESRVGVISGLTDGFVHKPFTTEYLREIILKILQNRAIIENDIS